MNALIIVLLSLISLVLGILNIQKNQRISKLKNRNRRLDIINDFFINLNSAKGPSLQQLINIDLKVLKSVEQPLMEYYRRRFFKLVAKSAIEEIEPYIKNINDLPPSPQKEFIKATLRKEILSGKGVNLVDIIFRIIKLSNTNNSNCGSTLKKFLFDDVSYLLDRRQYIITVLKQCKESLEKIAVDENVKPLMISDFDKLISKINK